ncbi:DNA glycosylase [Patellaria atrata CBS 101060]|uniref:DNA glycosylase n=1 Tax=Patellaria atrata CBS 101060 TaxID=1346257 RepID=A0A9P4SC81_9PEZI|nr:DNA glycosylase [Patellaria atrata CBS 101060]
MPRVTRSTATIAKQDAPNPQSLSSPPTKPSPVKREVKGNGRTSKLPSRAKKESPIVPPKNEPITPASTRKRKRPTPAVKDEEDNELPHNLGTLPESEAPGDDRQGSTPNSKRACKVQKQIKSVNGDSAIDSNNASTSPSKKGKNTKKSTSNPAGQDPFPDWPHPTPEECYEVTRLLSSIHGEVKIPKELPTPSLTVSGCGEVPSVLDALIRTLLSAATTAKNSSRAFRGLADRFGILQSGIGKGSVDWDAVRRAETKDIFEAIKCGGLADTKSKRIKALLQRVYEENQARRDALISSSGTQDPTKAPAGAENESPESKDVEIARADQNIISLDHIHSLSTSEAITTLTKYDGIGIKTASCVALFCLQRPSFAVDTHIFRICKWLGWVPEKANRETTHFHCDVRIPDELKYPLHSLFITHGRLCPRCRAITGEGSAGWDEGCVIEHLVKRSGVRKGGVEGESPSKKARVARTPKKQKGKGNVKHEGGSGSQLSEEGVSDDAQTPVRKVRPSRTPRKKALQVEVDEQGSESELTELEDSDDDFKD